MIRIVKETDTLSICDIYNFYIKNSTATFEEDVVRREEIERRIMEVTANYPWVVYEENEKIIGYAYATKWKDRSSYRYSAESTVYVHKDNFGKGIGRKLMIRLIEESSERGLHKLIAGIALPNDASIALHEKLGFVKCGVFKEVGFKFGKWIDVGYWEIVNRQP